MDELRRIKKNSLSAEHTISDFYDMAENFFRDKLIFGKSDFPFTSFRIDVQEKENEYIVDAELPGFSKEEISIELSDETLTITAEKTAKTNAEKKDYVRRERRYETVRRSVYLEDSIQEGIKAKLCDGILCITVPRGKSEHPAKKIPIE